MIRRAIRWTIRFLFRWTLRAVVLAVLLVLALRWVNPPVTYLQATERARLGQIETSWTSLDDLGLGVADAAVAAEDANFCRHNGFDFEAIRAVLEAGERRGASTISQQVAKNVFLWPGRSWLRKGLEAGFTVMIELLWGKRRIIEVYLNVAEFDEGVFGANAGAETYFGKTASSLSASQAARLMTVLPNPKGRSAAAPSSAQQRRAKVIAAGAATIAKDDRGACYRRP